jgi:dolichol-phosphate mannosyltransferase
MTAGEQWLQPAMLTTLVYRTGAAGARESGPERLLANGQCFLARAAALTDGYAPAKLSFSDDVTLARHSARAGKRVGFLDGSRLYRVRSYESLRQMWREWGRSIDLRDSATRGRQVVDALLLILAMGLPLFMIAGIAAGVIRGSPTVIDTLIAINAAFLLIRVLLLGALAGSYERPGSTFWLSPIADPVAVLRVILSTIRRPQSWRGRRYSL